MATPTASPQVASTVGLKNVVIAPLTEDTDTSHTYGELQLVAGAIEATITPTTPTRTSSTPTTSSLTCSIPIRS